MIAEKLRIEVQAEVRRAITELNRMRKTTQAATQQGNKLRDSFSKLGKRVLAGAGTYFALSKLTSAARELYRAFREQEMAEAGFRAALMATGKEAKISTNSMFKFAAKLQKVTTHGDEATIAAMGLLQQLADLDEEGLRTVTPSLLDFSDAMGVDLKTAASLVGKTLGSTTNALSRYGIIVDMSGTKQEKLTALTQALDSKFGGMSRTIAETASGSMTQLGNAVGDLKEQMGGAIVTSIQPFIKWLTNVAVQAAEAFSQMAALNTALEANVEIRKKQELKGDLQALRKEYERIQKTEEAGMRTGGRTRAETARYMAELQNKIEAAERQLIKLGKTNTKTQYEVQLNTKRTGDMLANNVTEEFDSAGIAAGNFADIANKSMEFSATAGTGTGAAKATAQIGLLRGETEKLHESIGPTTGALAEMAEKFGAGSMAGRDMSMAMTTAEMQARRLNETLTEASDEVIANLEEALTTLHQTSAESLGEMIVSFEDGAESLKESFKGFVATALEALAELFMAQAAGYLLINPAAAAGLFAAATGAYIAAGAVKALAEGGVVTQPTNALIGERGPEAVIPLDKLGKLGGDTYHIYNIQGSYVSEREMAKKVSKYQSVQRGSF